MSYLDVPVDGTASVRTLGEVVQSTQFDSEQRDTGEVVSTYYTSIADVTSTTTKHYLTGNFLIWKNELVLFYSCKNSYNSLSTVDQKVNCKLNCFEI